MRKSRWTLKNRSLTSFFSSLLPQYNIGHLTLNLPGQEDGGGGGGGGRRRPPLRTDQGGAWARRRMSSASSSSFSPLARENPKPSEDGSDYLAVLFPGIKERLQIYLTSLPKSASSKYREKIIPNAPSPDEDGRRIGGSPPLLEYLRRIWAGERGDVNTDSSSSPSVRNSPMLIRFSPSSSARS